MIKGQMITGDFEENTMTFEIDGEMTLQAGNYVILKQDEYDALVKNNVGLADVGQDFDLLLAFAEYMNKNVEDCVITEDDLDRFFNSKG